MCVVAQWEIHWWILKLGFSFAFFYGYLNSDTAVTLIWFCLDVALRHLAFGFASGLLYRFSSWAIWYNGCWFCFRRLLFWAELWISEVRFRLVLLLAKEVANHLPWEIYYRSSNCRVLVSSLSDAAICVSEAADIVSKRCRSTCALLFVMWSCVHFLVVCHSLGL